MTDIQDLRNFLDDASRGNMTDRDAMEVAVLVYKRAGQALKDIEEPFEQVRSRAKAIIEGIMERTQKFNWNSELDNGSAYVPAVGTTVKWNADLLEAILADANTPEHIRYALTMARMVKETNPSLTIK